MDSMNEDEFIGEPMENVPQRDPDYHCNGRKKQRANGSLRRDEEGRTLFAGYCRNRAGKGTDHVGEGRCDRHGGATLRGEEHPNFKHGLFADVVREEDRDLLASIDGVDNAEGLQEMINYELLRVRRAIEFLEGEENSGTFFDAFHRILEASKETGIGPDDIGALAKLLDSGQKALIDRMDHIRKMMKTYQELTDGQKINLGGELAHRHGGDPDGAPLSIEWKRSSLEEEASGDE